MHAIESFGTLKLVSRFVLDAGRLVDRGAGVAGTHPRGGARHLYRRRGRREGTAHKVWGPREAGLGPVLRPVCYRGLCGLPRGSRAGENLLHHRTLCTTDSSPAVPCVAHNETRCMLGLHESRAMCSRSLSGYSNLRTVRKGGASRYVACFVRRGCRSTELFFRVQRWGWCRMATRWLSSTSGVTA